MSIASRTHSPQVGRNLVIAAAAGVNLAADIAQAVDQRPLDVHVDVFELSAKLEVSLLNLVADLAECLHNLLALELGEQLHLGQHLSVGDRGADVLGKQPPVEAHALGELLDAGIGSFGEGRRPKACVPRSNLMPNRVKCAPTQNIHCKWLTTKCQRTAGSGCRAVRQCFRAVVSIIPFAPADLRARRLLRRSLLDADTSNIYVYT